MTEITDFSDFGLQAPPSQAGGRDELGQEDFLKLMMAQFQNQDPFSPMENGEFLGQLAQFGTVNGIEQLNGAFAGLQHSIQNDQALQAANLVGHAVLAETDVGFLSDEGRVAGAIETRASVSDVEVEITDVNGQLIRRLNLGEQPPGLVRFEWDGSTQEGARAEPGVYRIATRVIQGGYIESAQTLIESNIESVSLGGLGQGLTLNVSGGGTLSLDDVRRIL